MAKQTDQPDRWQYKKQPHKLILSIIIVIIIINVVMCLKKIYDKNWKNEIVLQEKKIQSGLKRNARKRS